MRVSPERVLLSADAVGGVWQFSVDLARGLARLGIDVLVACLGPEPSNAQIGEVAALPGVTLVQKPYALEWMRDAGEDVRRSGDWLLQLAAEFRPALVHLNGYAHAALPWGVPALVTAHSCVASWWRAVHGEAPPSGEWAEYMQAVAAGLARASLVVAPTVAMARALAAEHPVDTAKMRVVQNFSNASSVARAGKRPVCLAAGRIWDKAKNLALLDAIAAQLDWPVEVAGQNKSPDHDTAGVNSLSLLGEMPHHALLDRMRAASIFAHPALYEPFGLSVLEAARSRCCLMLSAIPSLQELWEGCACFADPRDPQQWVFELNRLMRAPAECGLLAERAAERSSQYSEEATLRAYLECYRSVLDSEDRAAA